MAEVWHLPVPFEGTEDERRANYATHHFVTHMYSEDDAETRCMDCDCRPSHVAADYPCGTEPPRKTVVYESPTAKGG